MGKIEDQKIITVARGLFKEKGYKKTSMVKIAEAAGVSLGTLYSHFNSKERLFEAVKCPELKSVSPQNDYRRQVILKVALSLFANKGYHVTNMDDIAEASGYGKTIIYQLFSSKEVLFTSLFTESNLFEGDCLSIKSKNESLESFLRKVANRFLDLFDSQDRLNLLKMAISEKQTFPEIGDLMYKHTVDKLSHALAGQLKILMIDTNHKIDYQLASRSFLGMLYSFVLTDRILSSHSEEHSRFEVVEFAVALFCKGLS